MSDKPEQDDSEPIPAFIAWGVLTIYALCAIAVLIVAPILLALGVNLDVWR
jgi:hypothetical protein